MPDKTFITLTHLEIYGGSHSFKIGDELRLHKEIDNLYDDESIALYNENNIRCAYVANSVYSVIRGTKSAGRIYDKIDDKTKCIIRFIAEENMIAEII